MPIINEIGAFPGSSFDERKYAVASKAIMTMPENSVFNFSALVHNKSAAWPEPGLLI
jgi:hypothetical protein